MKPPEIALNPMTFLPLVGLGTWQLKGDICTRVVKQALEIGYRHFDTAHIYENHTAIREAIKHVPRKQLFLTSKFTLPQTSHTSVEKLCEQALRELDTDYLDLYLLHYPDRSFDINCTLQEMQKLIVQQKVKAIGVSNFTIRHLQDLLDQRISVSVNQVEFHPYLNQKALLTFCLRHKIHVMSYRSLGKGMLAADPVFEKIGAKYGKTPAQICLHWLVAQGISVIPKSASKKHLEENFAIFDFELDSEDMTMLSNLDKQHRFCQGEWSDFNY